VIAAVALAVMPALAAQAPTITASDTVFTPAELTVAPGEAVKLANADGTHNFRFQDGDCPQFPTPSDNPVWDDLSRTFAQTGDYTFVCGAHPNMTGVVRVREPAATPTATPTPTPTPGVTRCGCASPARSSRCCGSRCVEFTKRAEPFRWRLRNGPPMRRGVVAIAVTLVLAPAVMPALAATDDETLTARDFSFEPDDVTLAVGDTVTFTIDPGSGAHNFAFDDGPDPEHGSGRHVGPGPRRHASRGPQAAPRGGLVLHKARPRAAHAELKVR
jgi:plastocyanin